MDILKLYKKECCSKIQEIRKRCVCRLKYLNAHRMIIAIIYVYLKIHTYDLFWSITIYNIFEISMLVLSQIHEKIISNNCYLLHQDYDEEDLLECKEILLEKCDLNHDGKINKKELAMVLMSYNRISPSDEPEISEHAV